jgi:hypothetical protein
MFQPFPWGIFRTSMQGVACEPTWSDSKSHGTWILPRPCFPRMIEILGHCTVPVATWLALILWIEWLCWFIRKHILYPCIWKLLNANTKAVLDILVNHEKPSDCRVPYSQTNTYCLQALPWMFFLSPYDSDNSSNFLWIFMEIGTANWRLVSELSWLLQ